MPNQSFPLWDIGRPDPARWRQGEVLMSAAARFDPLERTTQWIIQKKKYKKCIKIHGDTWKSAVFHIYCAIYSADRIRLFCSRNKYRTIPPLFEDTSPRLLLLRSRPKRHYDTTHTRSGPVQSLTGPGDWLWRLWGD